MTELIPEQIGTIETELATAPKIQKDLRKYISKITEPYDTVGLDDSIFDFAELVGYRINNYRLDIAEDLDLEERYGLINDQPRNSVGRAFRGHHNEEFMPDYQFEGLFSEEMNDMIEKIGKEKGGRASVETHGYQMRNGGLIGGQATIETHGDQMRNGGRATVETHGYQMRNGGRKGGLIGGLRGHWRDNPELLEDICELRNEGLTWKETTSEMNEKYGEDYTTVQVKKAYHNNKHLLSDEEE